MAEHILFYKSGKKEHLEVLGQGFIYMNPITYFSNRTVSDSRKDPTEGAILATKAPFNLYITPCGVNQFTHLKSIGTMILSDTSRSKYTHIFCFSYFEFQGNTHDFSIPDEVQKNYSDTDAYMIFAPDFLSDILKSLEKSGYQPVCREIAYADYRDPSNALLDGFTKDNSYSWEKEIRIGIIADSKNPLNIKFSHQSSPQVMDIFQKVTITCVPQGDISQL